MPDYQRARSTANRMIADAGKEAFLLVPNTLAPEDPYNPTVTPPVRHLVKAVQLEYSNFERQNSLIDVNDKKMLVSVEGLPVVPTADHKLMVNDIVYDIVRVMPFEPGPITIFYEIQVRR